MKKKLASILSLVLAVFFLAIPTKAFASTYEKGTEVVLGTKLSINDIDSLMEDKMEALVIGDTKTYQEISNKLEQSGVRTVSLQEVRTLTGGSVSSYRVTPDNSINTTAASSATFQTVYSTYTTGGKSYDVMRVYAIPSGSTGTLYQTGVTAIKNSKSAAANAMAFTNIAVSATAGLANNTISAVQTVYSALSGSVKQLSSTSAITDIQTSYTWNAAETCAFIYFKSSVTGAWMLAGQYSKVAAGVLSGTPILKVNNSSVIASIVPKNYSGSASPTNYDAIANAYSAYSSGGSVYSSRVSKITVTGIEGKSVKTISLANPSIPGVIN